MSLTKAIHLNLFSKPVTVFICILEDIKCENIKTVIPTLNCCLINPKLICSFDQLTAAITRTVSSFTANSMKLRSPYTELLFNLSPSSNVTDSLKTFGAAEDCTFAIAVRIVPEISTHSSAFENDLKNGFNCKIGEFSKLCEKCDWTEIKKLYKPTTLETDNQQRFIGEIVSLIATKNI